MMQVETQITQPVMEIFCKTALEVCEGQQLDMDFETMEQVSIEDYIHMIGLKTAVLLAASLEIGALIAGAGSNDAENIYSFGKNMGIAFQLQDDYLDVYGDSAKFGKQVGGDILSNKKTFLLLKAFELADEKTRSELSHLLLSEKDAVAKVKKVKEIFDLVKVGDHSQQKIEYYFEKGMDHLNAIKVEDEKKSNLIAFAEMLLEREH
jgi:geranylgeranyl diphosphate synthase type II